MIKLSALLILLLLAAALYLLLRRSNALAPGIPITATKMRPKTYQVGTNAQQQIRVILGKHFCPLVAFCGAYLSNPLA